MYFVPTSEDVGCPVFQNDKIIQQPANFLTVEANYIYEATSFIKTQAGQLLSCVRTCEVVGFVAMH